MKVIILDRSYNPVGVKSLESAATLLLTGKALPLDNEGNLFSLEEWIKNPISGLPVLRSPSLHISIPNSLILQTYQFKYPKRPIRYTRFAVFKRDKFTCQYCGHEFLKQQLSVDHVIPKSRGGSSAWTNLTTACKPCNQWKGSSTPEEAGMRLMSIPRNPTWMDLLG